MKKKYILLIILVLVIQTFSFGFLYVDASSSDNSESSICAGPSETMSLYFQFQNEMKSVLLGSRINERRFSVSMGKGGLFSEQILTLTNDTALDLVSNSVWNRTRSLVSNATTTVVLIGLATASVIESVEGLAVLFRDRSIVRDYRTMLDIESALFDVAYFRSKQVNLTRPVDGDITDQVKEVVRKYQDLGLLKEGTAELGDSVSMSDIIWDLLWMNAVMKHFVVYNGGLDNYHGCMKKSKDENCVAIIEFSEEAIGKLQTDYERTFLKCNHNYKSSISKSTMDSFKSGWQDVEDAMKRLKEVWVTGWNWPRKKDRGCNISAYEQAQLRAYLGDAWTCDYIVDLPDLGLKKSIRDLRKNSSPTSTKTKTSRNKIDSKTTTSEKKQERFYIYGTGSEYNPEYSFEMDVSFFGIYESIKKEYDQSVWNAQAGDLSNELYKIRGLVDQIDTLESKSDLLKIELEKIANYQCTG